MFRDHALTLFRVRGVPVRAHWTLLLIIPYLAYALSVQFAGIASLAGVDRDHVLLPPIAWGVLLALGLFASVTLHELAHTLVAIRFGGKVQSITLMLVGGVSQLTRVPRRPRHEAMMTAAGPLTSLALGAGCYLAFAATTGGPVDLRMAWFYLGAMNIALGLFNLVPAFPMDGGRLLRAMLSNRLGRERATEIAATIGKLFAFVLGGLGVWTANLLLVLVAVFVYSGANGELMHERLRGALAGLRLADLLALHRPPPRVDARTPLRDLLIDVRDLDHAAWIVVDHDGAARAVIQLADLERLSPRALARLTVGELVARLPERLVVVAADARANDVTERVAEAGAEHVIVVDPHTREILGLVSLADFARIAARQLVARRLPTSTRAGGLAA